MKVQMLESWPVLSLLSLGKNSVFDQVFSRTVDLLVGLNPGATVLDFTRNDTWRLSVQETTGTSSLRITVTTGFSSSLEEIVFLCAPGSAVEYSGCNSATVQIRAVHANCTANVQVGPIIDSQYILEKDDIGQNVSNAAWVDLGSNAGHPPPFMNYAAILTSGTIDIRTSTLAGGVFFEALGLASHTLLLNQFKIGNYDRLQARGTGAVAQNIRVVWYNRR